MSTHTTSSMNINQDSVAHRQLTDYHFITNITESKRQTGHYFVLVIGQKSLRLVEHASPNTNIFELDWANLSLKINHHSKGTEFNQAFYIKLKRILDLPQKKQAVIFRKKRTTITPYKVTQESTEAPNKEINPIYQLLLTEGFFRNKEDLSASEIIASPTEISALISEFRTIIEPLKIATFSPSNF